MDYNTAGWIWLALSAIAAAIALASLVQAVAGWRGPNRNRRLLRFALGLVALPLLFIGFKSFVRHVIVPRDQERARLAQIDTGTLVRVGDPAPAFPQNAPGKVVLVNFFATWCGPCLEELPHLQKLWAEHRDNPKFSLVVIAREETDEAIQAFKTQHSFTFPTAADPDRAIYSLFATEIIPRTYLIADGKIAFTTAGYYEADVERLRKALARELEK